MDYKKLKAAIGDPSKWGYSSMDTLGGQCACGKKNIVYRYHIVNSKNGATAIVGSECIRYFEGTQTYDILRLADKQNRKIKEMENICNEVLQIVPLAEKHSFSGYLTNREVKDRAKDFLAKRKIEHKHQYIIDWLKPAKIFLRSKK